MTSILQIENVSKKYRIRRQPAAYLSLRERLRDVLLPTAFRNTEDFSALENVSFDVEPGESVGIIGRNGAGKSTLLKILSKITPPTSGRIVTRGRIASLLEVGTGFHPELTGRENIFFNGSLLGMKKREIISRLDAIVDFSGVEKFLETPLKHYSSGMQLRLAFSVAAFLEPEILIVDEVLAVGDAEFQKKCMGKMESVTRNEGRTVLFVSHNMSAIENLCKTCILLNHGRMEARGLSSEVVKQYLLHASGEDSKEWRSNGESAAAAQITRVAVELIDADRLIVKCAIQSLSRHNDYFIAVDVLNSMGVAIFQALPHVEPFLEYTESEREVTIEIDLPPLIPDRYSVSVWIGPHFMETFCWEKEVVTFSIEESPSKGRNFPHSHHNGFMVPNSKVI